MVEFVGVHWTTIIKYYVYTPHCSCNAAVDWQPSRLSALNSHRLSNLYVWLVCIMTRKYSAALNSIAHVKSWEILGWNEVHDIHVVEVSDTLFMFLLCNWALNQFPPAEIFLFEIYVFEMDRIIDSSDPPCHWPNRQKILLRWIIVMEAICGAATTFVFAASVQLPPSLSSSKELGQASGYWTRCPTEVCLMKSLSIITSTWMDTKVQVRLCYSLVTYCKTTETNEGGGSNVPKWFKWGGKQKNTCKFTIQTWTNKQCTSKGIHRYDASTQAAWTLELQCQIGWEEREMDQWKFFNEVQPDLPEIVWGCCDSGNPESFESPCGVEWHQRSCHCATSATAWSGLLVGVV